jgi:hypothetical protein
MGIRMRLMVAVIFLIAAIACGKGSSPTAPTPTTVNATIVSGGFTPNPINISVGSTVIATAQDTCSAFPIAELRAG